MPPWPPWVTQHGIDAKIHLVEELYREMEEIQAAASQLAPPELRSVEIFQKSEVFL